MEADKLFPPKFSFSSWFDWFHIWFLLVWATMQQKKSEKPKQKIHGSAEE